MRENEQSQLRKQESGWPGEAALKSESIDKGMKTETGGRKQEWSHFCSPKFKL